MLFNSFTYLVFLPIVVLLYWLLPERFRTTLLLVASYVFYMNWMPAYGLLILALTLVNYALGIAIDKHREKGKTLLTVGLAFNLGCLCFFKYANFLADSVVQSVNSITHMTGTQSLTLQSPALKIILPLGISFFTFEFIHYITDIYRGHKPVKNIRDFALFAAFFPSQIAGPIKRFQDFIHQLEGKIVFKAQNFSDGLFLIFQGLFKKIVLGDNLGAVVSAGFSNIEKLGTVDAWIAVAGFTFQIFFDFAGYTDIGRGSALLFGYKVPENFNLPFLAANLTDFWRRWHMSLSTWLRDYLFIPLGGSRGSAWKVRRNVLITMILGGLWHGAAWHYVIWGAFHGAGLVLSKEWQDLVTRHPVLARLRPHPIWHCTGVALTVFFLFLAGILFRADGLPQAFAIAQKMFILAPSNLVVESFLGSSLPLSLSLYWIFLITRTLLERSGNKYAVSILQWWLQSAPAQAVAYISIAIVVLGFAPMKVAPFIYFQF
jgi:alginate O-acetyltransferase complex protein AlgI